MAKVYIKLFYDFIEMTEPLTHEERGRLVLAMLEYAQNKQVPDDALTGNERVLFPLFRRMVDWELDSYAKLCDQNSRNGKKGGRPKKPGITQNNPSVFPETEKSQEQEQDQEQEQEQEKEPGRGCAEAPHAPALDEVLDFCRENGMSVNGETFWNFYQAVGWQVGSRPIRDWRAQLRVWASRESQGTSPAREAASALEAASARGAASARNNPARAAPFPSKASAANPALNYAQRSYSDDDSFFIDLDAYAARTQT